MRFVPPKPIAKSFFAVVLVMSVALSDIRAEVITPVDVIATSEFGVVEFLGTFSDVFAIDLIDGGGLIDVEDTPDFVLDDLHDNDGSSTNAWHSGDMDAGIPGGIVDDGDPFTPPPVDDQILEFDLGAAFVVTHAHIWQQNQAGFGAALAIDRGVDEFDMYASTSADGDDFTIIGRFPLEAEEGVFEVPAQIVEPSEPFVARRIRFDLVSAVSGLDNEFVGLSEVRFEGEPVPAVEGDFNGDLEIDVIDIDMLTAEVQAMSNDAAFDLTGDQIVDSADRVQWIEGIRNTYFGDSNLDGEFNSTDFVVVFSANEYEDGVPGNSTWAEGDWNGDGDFDSADFVAAFISGGYEMGPRVPVVAVPEPVGIYSLLIVAALLGATRARR